MILGINGSISLERRCEDQLGSRAPGSKFADPKKPGKYVTKNLASHLTFNLDFDCEKEPGCSELRNAKTAAEFMAACESEGEKLGCGQPSCLCELPDCGLRRWQARGYAVFSGFVRYKLAKTYRNNGQAGMRKRYRFLD